MPTNFTVTWDGHNYTYRTVPNITYTLETDQFEYYGFTVHMTLGRSRPDKTGFKFLRVSYRTSLPLFVPRLAQP